MNSLSPLRCPHGCKPVKQGFKLVRRYGPHYTPLYECLRCGQQFSGRYDSVFSGFHTDEQTIYRVLKALSEALVFGPLHEFLTLIRTQLCSSLSVLRNIAKGGVSS